MNKIRGLCIGLSLLAHVSLVGALNNTAWMKKLIPVMPMPVPVQKAHDMEVEFVDTPDNAEGAKEVTKNSKVISDKSVKAKDSAKEQIKEGKAKAKILDKVKQLDKNAPSSPSQPSVKPVPPSLPAAQLMPEEELPKKVEPVKPELPKKKVSAPNVPAENVVLKESQVSESEKRKEEKPPDVVRVPTMVPEQTPIQRPLQKPQEAMKSIPQQPQKPTVEYDIVNLPEVSESIFSSPNEGDFSIEAQEHKIGPYFKKIKKQIEAYWLRYLFFKYQNTAPKVSEVVVSFKILPSGELGSVKVLEFSGDPLFRDFCVAAVTNNAPFDPLPENIKEEYKKDGGLDVVFTFKYQ